MESFYQQYLPQFRLRDAIITVGACESAIRGEHSLAAARMQWTLVL